MKDPILKNLGTDNIRFSDIIDMYGNAEVTSPYGRSKLISINKKTKKCTAEKIKYILKLKVPSRTIHRFLKRVGLINEDGYHRRPRFQNTIHMHAKNVTTVGYLQMDVKVGGIPIPILVLALEKARLARLHILKTMLEALPEARKDISPRAPKIVMLKINKEQIGLVIGSGGKTINEIREKTGTEITIEDDGVVYITGKNGGAEKAKAIIEAMTHEYRAGEKVMGTITKIVDFGAFVKFGFNNEGLVHISEIAPFRIEVMGNHLKEGMEVPLVIKGTDERGKIALSIKQADATFAEKVGFAPKAAPEQKN
jgi:predicted RNA-binding protein with RPS1 domain